MACPRCGDKKVDVLCAPCENIQLIGKLSAADAKRADALDLMSANHSVEVKILTGKLAEEEKRGNGWAVQVKTELRIQRELRAQITTLEKDAIESDKELSAMTDSRDKWMSFLFEEQILRTQLQEEQLQGESPGLRADWNPALKEEMRAMVKCNCKSQCGPQEALTRHGARA